MHSKDGKHVTRETVITVVLFMAGIVLAVMLFGAGVFWKSLPRPKIW